MRKLRYGVLELISITGDRALMQCIVHVDKRPFTLTLQQLQDGAKQCPACYYDSQGLRQNQHNHTGQRFSDWVAVKDTGLSRNATTIRGKQQQWQDSNPFGLRSYSRNKYWLCYHVKCRHKIEIRGDKLRAGETPKRCPICRK